MRPGRGDHAKTRMAVTVSGPGGRRDSSRRTRTMPLAPALNFELKMITCQLIFFMFNCSESTQVH